MKYLDEYHQADAVHALARLIEQKVSRPWSVMEVCGGQTHSIVKHGIDRLLPSGLELLHGPGCPVCVTPLETIDRAHAIAARPGVIFCSFGDMLKIPGSHEDLLALKSQGADIRIVYSPLDALSLAERNPERQVVFFAIGFETTAPANALAIHQAKLRGLTNFSALVAHVTVPPAITAILKAPDNRVQGFLGPGHVCTIMGIEEYAPVVQNYTIPIVVAGFEPVDLLEALLLLVTQLEEGRAELENQYSRAVRRAGNHASKTLVEQVFEPCDRTWRGIGVIPQSGYRLRNEYQMFDAELLYEVEGIRAEESTHCISGQVLRGVKKPCQCPAFNKECTPQHPLGPTMVSSEGACAAYFNYGRHKDYTILAEDKL